ncbi:hypothetical protein [Fusobacterium nucleatum]|uniref:hypothetical protein n=1 Tax=Fusobacterium nucleatum TaxID=851 RepID=UPI00235ECE62|nr:hypothetical protein [Fusobacterium nucleatum]WDD90160.1 hypothetical protein PSR68_04030 [Fusobacterium nucleatum]
MIELAKGNQKNEEEVKNEVNNEIKEDNKEVQEDNKEEAKEIVKEEAKEIVKEGAKENFTRIYIGPTILAYNLVENTVFIDSFPENINKAIEKYPTINNLMIDIDKLQDRNNEYYKNNYLILKNELGGK